MVRTRQMANNQPTSHGSSSASSTDVAEVDAMISNVAPAMNAAVCEEAVRGAVDTHASAQDIGTESDGALQTDSPTEDESISTGPRPVVHSNIEFTQGTHARSEGRGGERGEGQPPASAQATTQIPEFQEIRYPQTITAQNKDGRPSSPLSSAPPSPTAAKEAQAERKKPRKRRGPRWTRVKGQKSKARTKAKANVTAQCDENVAVDNTISPAGTSFEDGIKKTEKEKQRPTERPEEKAAEIPDAVRDAEAAVRRNKGKGKAVDLPSTKEAATGSKRRRDEKDTDVDDITQAPLDPGPSRRTTRRTRQRVAAPAAEPVVEPAAAPAVEPAAEPLVHVDESNVRQLRQRRIILPAEPPKKRGAKRKARAPEPSEAPLKRCKFEEPEGPLLQAATLQVTVAELEPTPFVQATALQSGVKLEEPTLNLSSQIGVPLPSLAVPEEIEHPLSSPLATLSHETFEQRISSPFVREFASPDIEMTVQLTAYDFIQSEDSVSIHPTPEEIGHATSSQVAAPPNETPERLAHGPLIAEATVPLPCAPEEIPELGPSPKNDGDSSSPFIGEINIVSQSQGATWALSREASEEMDIIVPERDRVIAPYLGPEEEEVETFPGDEAMDVDYYVEIPEAEDEIITGIRERRYRAVEQPEYIPPPQTPPSQTSVSSEPSVEAQDKASDASNKAPEEPRVSGILSFLSQPGGLWTGITRRLSFGGQKRATTPSPSPPSPPPPPPPPAPAASVIDLTGISPSPSPTQSARPQPRPIVPQRRSRVNEDRDVSDPYPYSARPWSASLPITRARSMAPEPSDDLIQALRAGRVTGCGSPIPSDHDFE